MEIAHAVTKAEYISEYRLRLTFQTGEVRVVDLSDRLVKKIFHPLKNLEYFKKVTVSPEFRTLVWPNGEDFCPDLLFSLGRPDSQIQRG